MFDRVWARFVRIVTFLGGFAIMIHETLGTSDRPWLYAAAIGMMGLPVANEAEKILSRFTNNGPQYIPPSSHGHDDSEGEAVQIEENRG